MPCFCLMGDLGKLLCYIALEKLQSSRFFLVRDTVFFLEWTSMKKGPIQKGLKPEQY